MKMLYTDMRFPDTEVFFQEKSASKSGVMAAQSIVIHNRATNAISFAPNTYLLIFIFSPYIKYYYPRNYSAN